MLAKRNSIVRESALPELRQVDALHRVIEISVGIVKRMLLLLQEMVAEEVDCVQSPWDIGLHALLAGEERDAREVHVDFLL